MTQTPKSLGYTFPPEWHRHAATWMSWPRPEGISFPDRYENVQADLARIVANIARFETVRINVPDADWAERVRNVLRDHGHADAVERVECFHVPTNEPWCRDHGPAFLIGMRDEGEERRADPEDSAPVGPSSLIPSPSSLAIVDFGFNAWGGKYPPWDDDDAVPTNVAKLLGLPVFDAGHVVMEGGAVDFDGRGSVITTTDCLLNPNRNPSLSKEQIEQVLLDYYGQRRVLWLTGGIAGDDTDGHIDDLARFIDPRTIVVGVERDKGDENYDVTQSALDQCRALVDPDGKPYDVIELPMPAPVEIEGERVPATYVNFAFVNDALLVPTYGSESDKAALALLQQRLPTRQVVGVDCREVIWGLGAIHCLTQQQPAV